MPKFRLKGQACLKFWYDLCDQEEKRDVPTHRLEAALAIQFPSVEKNELELIVNHVILHGRKSSVSIEEFDNFVRKFLPFEDSVKLAVESLIDPQTQAFFPWFHGFEKTEFAASSTPSFFLRLSANTRPFHDIIPARCLVENSICPPEARVIVHHITRVKNNGKYCFHSSHPPMFFDSLSQFIATRKAQNYAILPSPNRGWTLSDLAAQPDNLRCFDCQRTGAQTTVCLNYGTFICTSCAGLHRELGHVVKPLLSSFSPSELEALAQAGNKVVGRLLLAGCNREGLNIDSAEAMRNFLKAVYIERRWVPEHNTARDSVSHLEPSAQNGRISELETPPRTARGSIELDAPLPFLGTNEAKPLEPVPPKPRSVEGFRGDLIPLSSIPDKWLLVNPLLLGELPRDVEGPAHALHATLMLLQKLYYLEHPRWKQLRDKVQLGLVKDTKQYGNTSVSMGAAKISRFDERAGFLNCGSRGIKYQMYSKAGGVLHLEAEFKPKQGASPNCLQVGGFQPKQPASFDECRRLLLAELQNDQMPWRGMDIPQYAFVTGTIRNYWEGANAEERARLELAMEQLFASTGIQRLGNSFFITQDEEGQLELLGSRAMYANLAQAGLLDTETEVVASFGIGGGSCQWMVLKSDGQTELIAHKAGMNNLAELAKVSETVLNAYTNMSKLNVFLDALEQVEHPVIALKSGCALLLEMKDYPSIKQSLVSPVKHCPPKTVYISRNGNLLRLEWTGSLDRLCAQATNIFEEDLQTVYHADSRALATEDDIKDEDTLVLRPLELPKRNHEKKEPVKAEGRPEVLPQRQESPEEWRRIGDENASRLLALRLECEQKLKLLLSSECGIY